VPTSEPKETDSISYGGGASSRDSLFGKSNGSGGNIGEETVCFSTSPKSPPKRKEACIPRSFLSTGTMVPRVKVDSDWRIELTGEKIIGCNARSTEKTSVGLWI
jgi:hypothetical protein